MFNLSTTNGAIGCRNENKIRICAVCESLFGVALFHPATAFETLKQLDNDMDASTPKENPEFFFLKLSKSVIQTAGVVMIQSHITIIIPLVTTGLHSGRMLPQ